MSTKKKLIETVKKLPLFIPYTIKSGNAIKNVIDYTEYYRTTVDNIAKLQTELFLKQNTQVTKKLLIKNGFQWGLTSDEQDQEALMNMSFEKGYVYDDAEIMVKFQELDGELCGIMYAINKDGYCSSIMANLNTVADLEDALDLCGIDKEIEL